MGMTPEGRIKALVKTRLKDLTDCYYFMPVQTGYGTDTLDFMGCYAGLFFAIETKKDRKSKLTPRQEACKARMEAAGAMVFVVYDALTAEEMITAMVVRQMSVHR